MENNKKTYIKYKKDGVDNIKLDIIELLDDIQNGKYSNIQMNYYFNEKNYTSKEKLFVTNIVNVTLKNLIYIDYLLSKVTKNIQKRRIKHLLRISAAQLFLQMQIMQELSMKLWNYLKSLIHIKFLL